MALRNIPYSQTTLKSPSDDYLREIMCPAGLTAFISEQAFERYKVGDAHVVCPYCGQFVLSLNYIFNDGMLQREYPHSGIASHEAVREEPCPRLFIGITCAATRMELEKYDATSIYRLIEAGGGHWLRERNMSW